MFPKHSQKMVWETFGGAVEGHINGHSARRIIITIQVLLVFIVIVVPVVGSNGNTRNSSRK